MPADFSPLVGEVNGAVVEPVVDAWDRASRSQCVVLGHLALSDFVRDFSADKDAFTMLVQMLSDIRTMATPSAHPIKLKLKLIGQAS